MGIPFSNQTERHLYKTTTDPSAANFRVPDCITCNVSDDCQYVDAKFGASGEFYVLGCLGPGVPYFNLYAAPDIFCKFLLTAILLQYSETANRL